MVIPLVAREFSLLRRFLLILMVVGLYAAHQDVWFWRSARPLVFGFLPVGLFYHAVYTLATIVLMALLVRWAWPAELESAHLEEDRGA